MPLRFQQQNVHDVERNEEVKYVKYVILDLVITLFILTVVLLKSPALNIALAVLIVLLLLARLSALSNKDISKKLSKKQPGVPLMFYHILNGVNVGLLLVGQMWLAAAAWGVIWYLSWRGYLLMQAKSVPKKSGSKKRKP